MREPQVEVMKLIGARVSYMLHNEKVWYNFASALWNKSSIEGQAILRHLKIRKGIKAHDIFNTSNRQPAVS